MKGEIALIRQFFAAAIDAVGQGTSAAERAAAVEALRQQLKDAVDAVTRRRQAMREARRIARRQNRQATLPPRKG